MSGRSPEQIADEIVRSSFRDTAATAEVAVSETIELRIAEAIRHERAVATDLFEALVAVSDMLFARPDITAKLHALMGPAEMAIADQAAAALTKARGGVSPSPTGRDG